MATSISAGGNLRFRARRLLGGRDVSGVAFRVTRDDLERMQGYFATTGPFQSALRDDLGHSP
jgi:hypothetical protein